MKSLFCRPMVRSASLVLMAASLVVSPLPLRGFDGQTQAEEFSWGEVAEGVAKHLDEMATHYRNGDVDAAKRSIVTAYFGNFEDRKMEAAMRKTMGKKHTFKVEKRFSKLRKAVSKGVPADDLVTMKDELIKVLQEDAAKLDDAGVPPEVYKVN